MKPKFSFSKIKEWFLRVIWNLGQHAFKIILLLVLIDLMFGAFLFYKYVYLAQIKDGELYEEILKFDNERYEKVLDKIQNKPSLQEDEVNLIDKESQETQEAE
jgi:hypothetical protein